MRIEAASNRATLFLEDGDTFYFKPSILTGYPHYNVCFVPPHPYGSPIMRIIYRSYLLMKKVDARGSSKEVSVNGYFPRGNFHSLTVPAGERHMVNARHVAGFCGKTAAIHTHIKFHPAFWCFREHFFSVFHGPATVLLYSRSGFESTTADEYTPSRIVSFNITRRLTPITPQPTSPLSLIYNVFSTEVIWKFIDPGVTIAETHHGEPGSESLSVWEVVKHLAGIWRF